MESHVVSRDIRSALRVDKHEFQSEPNFPPFIASTDSTVDLSFSFLKNNQTFYVDLNVRI